MFLLDSERTRDILSATVPRSNALEPMRPERLLPPASGVLPTLGLLALAACRPAQDEPAPTLVPIVETAAAHDTEAPQRPNFHDFGHVPDGETVEHVFRYRNASRRPIAILRVVPSCGCAVPSLRSVASDGTIVLGLPITADPPLVTVPPEGTLELELRIDTREVNQKNVDRLYTTRIESDAQGSFYVSFEAHLFVERAFEIAPAFLNLGRVAESVGGQGSVSVVQGPDFDFGVKEVVEASSGLVTSIRFEQVMQRNVWEVTARLDPPLARGTYRGSLRLATEDPSGQAGPELSIPVQGEIVGDIESVPARLVFAAPRSERKEVRGIVRSLVPGQRFRLTGSRVEEAHAALLEASFEPVEPDGEGKSGEWEVALATKPPLPAGEILRGNLVLATDDPAYPEVAVPYVVHLR